MPEKKSPRAKSSATKKNPKLKVLKSRVTYRAPVFYVTSEVVREPSGVTARRDIIRHPGSVVVMAVRPGAKEPYVLLARQFRYAAQKELWEFPAGRVDPGETVLTGAKRELTEETGFRAQKWTKALFFYVSPGFLDETMTIYLAQELTQGEASPEEDEVIRPKFFPLSKIVSMVKKGQILDAKTIAGTFWLAESLRKS